jgi:hypothetical protein
MALAPWEDELPVKTLPHDPKWRENYCFDGYDSKNDIGFWIHCARWNQDTRFWREQVLFYLPDGTYLVHRSWGSRPSEKGLSINMLDLTCLVPGEKWHLKYYGPARRTHDAELQAGPLPEGPQILVDLDLTFTSQRPVWDMTADMRDQAWGKFHTEQTGRLSGTISYEGRIIPMDGVGWRDHSRGPRSFTVMNRHCWIHGELSKGRSFALTYIENEEDGRTYPALEKGILWEADGSMHAITCPNPPYITSTGNPPPTYDMTLEYEKGSIRIHAEARRSLPHSSTTTQEVFDGVTPGLAHVVGYEQGTVFFVDGERFDGHTERCFRL